MVIRYSQQASAVRARGNFASATVCDGVRDDKWVAEALQKRPHELSVGDLALLAEYASQQWQRDEAVRALAGRRH